MYENDTDVSAIVAVATTYIKGDLVNTKINKKMVRVDIEYHQDRKKKCYKVIYESKALEQNKKEIDNAVCYNI